MENKPTLADLQKAVDVQTQSRGGYWPIHDIALQISSEAGEVADAVSKIYGKKPTKSGEEPPNIAHELADLLYAILCMSNVIKVDLAKAFIEKKKILEVRDKERFEK